MRLSWSLRSVTRTHCQQESVTAKVTQTMRVAYATAMEFQWESVIVRIMSTTSVVFVTEMVLLMDFVISILGVLIFVGLTAYDTQKIKNMYVASDTGELMGKKAVMGALTLYLDFINLFIMLLRLFGQRR